MNGSFLIPTKFKLKGKTITVEIDDNYCEENGMVGEADFTEKIITLCNKFKGKKMILIKFTPLPVGISFRNKFGTGTASRWRKH